MMEGCENPLKHHAAVYDKYKDRKYKRAATFVESEIYRGFVLPDNFSTASTVSTAGQPALKA
jgi:G2/mitotic-specific cyclin 3/4